VIHLVLTELSDPAAQRLRKETAGQAWLRIETVPVRYPVEHPHALCRALRRSDKRSKPGEVLWVLDVQAVQAIGACMGEGIPLHERIVAVGGPGASKPSHVRARVGTRLDRFLDGTELAATQCVLRGGLFRGTPVTAGAAVGYGDDAFFVLPRPAEREFLGFVKPGFDRVSILPCFASRLTGAVDRTLTTSLRGERRPCIACGLCEDVCPVGLMPQVLHRYLHRDAIDEAERTGLPLCIHCGLCSYVCPSKIELRHQFSEAQERLLREHEQAAAAEFAHHRAEDAQQREKEHSEDWRK
jgi:Na+-transporting NADH:ubiquinone oxidoreductase subunit A